MAEKLLLITRVDFCKKHLDRLHQIAKGKTLVEDPRAYMCSAEGCEEKSVASDMVIATVSSEVG